MASVLAVGLREDATSDWQDLHLGDLLAATTVALRGIFDQDRALVLAETAECKLVGAAREVEI